MKAKILFIGRFPPGGGVSRFCYEITPQISKVVDLILYDYSPPVKNKEVPQNLYEYYNSVPTSKSSKMFKAFLAFLKHRFKKDFENVKQLLKMDNLSATLSTWAYLYDLEKVAERFDFDLVHSQHPAVWSLLASRIAKRKNVPHIITLHGTLEKYSRSKRDLMIARQVCESATSVVCVSNYVRDLIISSGIEIKSKVIYHGVDTNIYNANHPTQKIIEKYGLKGKKIILFVGWLAEAKDPMLALQAAKEILPNYTNVSFIFIGSDHGEEHKMKEYMKENSLGDSVKILGALKGQALLSFYSLADIFISPSYSEGFGLTVIEAMASRTAVVVSNSCSFPEIVKDGETGLLFDTKSILGLTKAIERLLSDDYYLQKLASAAEVSVKRRFTWNKAGEEYTNLYKRIENQKGTLSNINEM